MAAPSTPRPMAKMNSGSSTAPISPAESVTYIARLASPAARKSPLVTMPIPSSGNAGRTMPRNRLATSRVSPSAPNKLSTSRRTIQRRADTIASTATRITNEEAAALKSLADALGVAPAFVSPEPNGLQDDLLHTGDPCPNRRGLTDAGFEAVSAEDARARLAEAASAVLVGERIDELLDASQLAELPAGLRLIALVPHPLHAPATNVCVGVPTCVEREGTWSNVDGLARRITRSRPAPAGVQDLTDSLAALARLIQPEEVSG